MRPGSSWQFPHKSTSLYSSEAADFRWRLLFALCSKTEEVCPSLFVRLTPLSVGEQHDAHPGSQHQARSVKVKSFGGLWTRWIINVGVYHVVPGSRGWQEQWGVQGASRPSGVRVHVAGWVPGQQNHKRSGTVGSWCSSDLSGGVWVFCWRG